MRPEVTIIGAGFSGLVAAWRLQKDGYSVTVVEKSIEAGGLIGTSDEELGLVETAANGLLCSRLVEELFSDCGLEIQTPKRSAKRRFIAVDGKVSRWPLTPFQTLQFMLRVARVRKSRPHPGESLYLWAYRALGENPANKLVGPAMLGVYAAEAELLSANLIVGKFLDKSKARNVRGKITGTVAARGGMASLILALKKHLESKGVVFNFTADGKNEINRARQRKVPVILAASAWDAAELIPKDPRSLLLQSVKPIPLLSLTLFFSAPPPKRGFGTLFSQSKEVGEPDGILGSLQNSEIFEGRVFKGHHSETWILGGAAFGEKFLQLSDDEVIDQVLEKRERWIDIESRKNLVKAVMVRWPKAIPLYSPELEKQIPHLMSDQDGVILFGNYLGDLGLASILESTKHLSQRVRSL